MVRGQVEGLGCVWEPPTGAATVTQGSLGKLRVALGKTVKRVPSRAGVLVSLCFHPARVWLVWAASCVT